MKIRQKTHYHVRTAVAVRKESGRVRYSGTTTDGNYFLTMCDWDDLVYIVSEDPESDPDECEYESWNMEYYVDEITRNDAIEFINEIHKAVGA